MSQLININPDLTMSSLEIVKVVNTIRKSEGNNTELRHDDFMRKVSDVLGELNATKFLGTQIYGNNNRRNIYNLPKREAMLMAMSYSYSVQAAVYDAYESLKIEQTPKELSRKDILLLALEAEERAEIAEARIERLVHSGRCHTTRQLAKEAGFKSAQELNAVLFNSKIIFKERGIWVLYSKYADKGYQEIKQQEFDNGHLGYTAEWTAAGREFVLDFCEKL